MTSTVAVPGLALGGYHGARQPARMTRSASAASGPSSPPACSGWVRGKLAHTADCGSTAGMASSSASSASAAKASGSRPAVSVASTGRSAAASMRAAASTSAAVGAVLAAGGAGPSAGDGCHGLSSTSTGVLTYTGPAGGCAASSPARLRLPYSTLTSAAADDHLVKGAATACGPPTTDRFRYHCEPGSGPAPSPYPVDSPEQTTTGAPVSRAPWIALAPCSRPAAACSSTTCGRPVTAAYPVAMPTAVVSWVRSKNRGPGGPASWRRANASQTGAHSDPAEEKTQSAPRSSAALISASPPSRDSLTATPVRSCRHRDRPVQAFADTASHDPLQLVAGEREVLGELLDGVGVGQPVPHQPGQVRAPETALRAHLVHHLADVPGDVEVGEGVRRVPGQGRDLDVDVRVGVQVRGLLGPVTDGVVHAAGHDAHVVDDDPQAGVAVGDGAEFGLPDGRVHHRGQAEFLGQRPVPVVGAVDHPVPVDRPVEGQPRAQDVRVRHEVPHHGGALGRLVLRDAGHDAEPVRVRRAGLQRVVDPVAFPGRRDDQRAVHPRLVHQRDALLVAEGFFPVPVEPDPFPGAGHPRAVRGLLAPNVNLRVNDEHGVATFLAYGCQR